MIQSLDLVEEIEAISNDLNVDTYAILTDSQELPQTSLGSVVAYESLISNQPTDYDCPELDEETECGLCCTSGTTGKPKGVTYSHRGMVLRALAGSLPDSLEFREQDVVTPVVPMYHANAWGFLHMAIMVGARQVLPCPDPTVQNHLRLIDEEIVTFTGGAVTVWVDALKALQDGATYSTGSLRGLLPGGQAVPKTIIQDHEEEFGVGQVYQAWRMTEVLRSPRSLRSRAISGTEPLGNNTSTNQSRGLSS